MIISALKWVGNKNGFLEVVDQRRLPAELAKLHCREVKDLYDAIKTLAVRGAPAIGVAGAYGLVLGMQKSAGGIQEGISALEKYSGYLGSSRPTAVNLSWAMERIKQRAKRFVTENSDAKPEELHQIIFDEANAIYREDVQMCEKIGRNGQGFIKDQAGILTHCNAGALATAGQGTALSVLFEAHKNKKRFKVYADETRPLLQGARLTAWELQRAGIDVTVICDSMAGWLMKQGKINAVITGADRIAANGDTANKIGTYSLSILARENKIPFYIAAPSSTFDMNIKSGSQIPIEQRPHNELSFWGSKRIVPEGVDIYNPAFDVTEAENITAIITELGVIENPDTEKIETHLQNLN